VGEVFGLFKKAIRSFVRRRDREKYTSLLPCKGHICESSHESLQNIAHLLALLHKSFTSPSVEIGIGGHVVDEEEYCNSIPSATELQEAGVKLRKLEGVNLFDIKFNNGVVKIPLLHIEDRSESIFRNLIAYEQYSQNNNFKYVTDYVTFMDYLINSPKDVELLRRRGIIENGLGDDEAVSTMFNKLGHCVVVSDFCYAQIFSNLKALRKTSKCVDGEIEAQLFQQSLDIDFISCNCLIAATCSNTDHFFHYFLHFSSKVIFS
jgi:hypothetical protein